MKTRAYQTSDYAHLLEWWSGHGWGGTALPESCIPAATTLVAETDGGEPAGCVVVYKFEGVPLARVGFAVNNPGLSARVRVEALQALADGVVGLFGRIGVVVAWALYDNRTLLRVFEEAGFVMTRESVSELTWSPNIGEALPQRQGGVDK